MIIIVNHMVRLAGLRFSPGASRPADRQLRSARAHEKIVYICNSILAYTDASLARGVLQSEV